MHSYKFDHSKTCSGFKMAESWIQTTQFLNQWEIWEVLKENNELLKYRHLWNIHAHTHTQTRAHFTQCQIKITQGNFQGCIYNHNDKNSIFEVAEVKEQTTAQAKKKVLTLTLSPLFGDTLYCARGQVLKRHVFHGEWSSAALETR